MTDTVTISVSLAHLRVIASMVPKSDLLRTEAMQAAIAFLGEVKRCVDEIEARDVDTATGSGDDQLEQ